MLNQTLGFGAGLLNVFLRLFYLPLAVLSFVFQLASQWRLLLVAFLIGGGSLIITNYIGIVASEVEFTMRCRISSFYVDDIRPILNGIIREFVNRIVCWYDAILFFPYGFGRQVVFPVMREGGFGPTVSAFARFLSQIGRDMFVNFFFTDRWFTEPLDFTNIYIRWQEFWTLWQYLLCYGCNDLCPFFTKLPVIPSFYGSDQVKDIQFLCGFGNMFNGWLAAAQQVIFLLRQILFPTQPTLPYADFRVAFEFMCASTGCFVRSWENALQVFWNTYIPFEFKWVNVLCYFDVMGCVMWRSLNLIVDLIIHAKDVYNHFANINSVYWNNNVRHMFTEIINAMGPTTFFNSIVAPIQNTTQSMVIMNYQLKTNEQSTPWGTPNVLYNTSTAGECLCIAFTRLLCDPTNNGTTCEQRFNGTLLSGVDPCCFTDNLGTWVSDSLSIFFEFTLHLFDFDDFILYTDKQPFTTLIKDDSIATISCLFQIFRSIKVYGRCIERILSELTLFIISTIELLWRILVSLLNLSYFQAFLPQTCNFISCPGDMALNMTLQYLNRISDPTNPDGLINCLCYILNNGFNVPYAGCKNISCVPMGFINPNQMKRWQYEEESFYDYATRILGGTQTYKHQLTPIMTYKSNSKPNSIEFSMGDLKKIPTEGLVHLDNTLKQLSIENQCKSSKEKRDLIYNNFTDTPLNCTDPMNPPPCFDLCCLPTKIILLASHTVSFGARALNAAFQTRFTDGSTYWNGKACPQNACLASDIVLQVTLSIAPLQCLCEFIKLVLPPQGFKDPCCAFSVAGELISVFIQIVINVGNSIAGDSPAFFYIRGNQTFNATGTQDTGIPLVNDFTVFLSLARTLFDCVCDFIRSIFAVAFSGFQQFKAFDPCCMFRVYFRAILELIRTALRLVLALTDLDGIPSQQFLYVNGYKNARPFSPFFIGDIGLVLELKNITKLLLAPPVKKDVVENTCAANVDLKDQDPDNEGIPTCLCNMLSALLAMINAIDVDGKGDLNMKPKCMLNICCPIYKLGNAYKNLLDVAIEFIATIWQNWEYKSQFEVAPGFPKINVFFPQETLNYFFCDEYNGANIADRYLPDGVTPNPYYDVNYLSVAMSQLFYAPFVQNKPVPYKDGFVPNSGPNATNGVINANTVYDPNNPQLQLIKCGKIEPVLAAIGSLFQNCLCSSGIINGTTTTGTMPYFNGETRSTCSLDNGLPGSTTVTNGIANMLDDTLRWLLAFVTKFAQIFPFQLIWPNCLCCGGPSGATLKGMIKPFGNVVVVGLRQIIEAIRNIANPTYWSMNGGTLLNNPQTGSGSQGFVVSGLNSDVDDFRRTWINRFLAPFADALCSFFTNSGCLLALILGNTCEERRYMLLSSIVRYYMEAIIVFATAIEGFKKLFSNERPGQCVGGAAVEGNAGYTQQALTSQGSNGGYKTMIPTCSPVAGATQGFTWQGINPDQLGRIISAILQFIVDALIGFSELACSAVCPRIPTQGSACNCYNLSPYINWGDVPKDRCGLAWYYYYAIDGVNVLYLPSGGNPTFYPPGSAGLPSVGVGCIPGPGSGLSWENCFCDKSIPCYPPLTPPICNNMAKMSGLCGDVCQAWMTNIWCRFYQGPLNPAPGPNITNWITCSESIMGSFASFTGQSMQNYFGGQAIWQRVSENPCMGSETIRINYCEAKPPANLINVPQTTISPESYVLSTILQTSTLGQHVPQLSPINGTAYDPTICDSPNYSQLYGTSVAQPYGYYTQAQYAQVPDPPPGGPFFGNIQLNVAGPQYGACNWFENQCSQSALFDKLKYLYGYANLIFFRTGKQSNGQPAGPDSGGFYRAGDGFSGAIPWTLCCYANVVGTNWTNVLNTTNYPAFGLLSQPVSTQAFMAFMNVDPQICADPRYSEFNWLNVITQCDPTNMINNIVDVMSVTMRNCRYAGVNAFDIEYINFGLAAQASAEAAYTCEGVPIPPCVQGGQPDNKGGLNFALVWDNVQRTQGRSFRESLQIYPILRGIGQCAICRVEATGCKVIDLRPKTFQPICDRASCIALGWCKNDMLVPCNALLNPAILDGVVISALRYFQCFSQNVFGNVGNTVGDLFGIFVTILKFIWQISGGLIRFVVTILLMILDILVTFVQSINVGSIADILLGVFLTPIKLALVSFQHFSAIFFAFISIFQQKLVAKDHIQYQTNDIMRELHFMYNFQDGHDCILKDPTFCFCASLYMPSVCRISGNTTIPSDITLNEILPYVRQHFTGNTNCDMLYEHLISLQIIDWVSNVSFAERFQAMECLTQRAKGESFHRIISQIPEDFFYNPYAMFETVISLFSEYTTRATKFIYKEHKKITKDHFKKRFNMSRDDFYKYINIRSYKVQDYYKHVHKISPSSIVWDPLLELDTYYFKYQSGYYHMLWENVNFMSHFGRRQERWEIAKQEFKGLVNITQNVIMTMDEKYGDVIRNLPTPEVPQLIRMIYDGSLWRGWKEKATYAPTFEGIKVIIHPWEVDNINLLPTLNWTPEITRNWEAGKRILYSIAHVIWPHYTTKEVHDKFISNGNCRLYDGGVALGTTLIDYCLNDFVENTPTSRSFLTDYLKRTSHLRKDSFFKNFKGRYEWKNHTSKDGTYRRPKVNTSDLTNVKSRHMFHHKTYKRAMSTPAPGGISGKFLEIISNLFGINLLQTLDNFVMDFQAWVTNPNINPADYPNVGVKYWFAFMIRCQFPENLNCSLGIGLSNALWQVGLVYLIVFLVLAFTFPAAINLISIVFSLVVYALIVAIVAWHYSPACIALFPSTEFAQGVTIPIFPVPLTILPTIPFCIWDDIIEVLDNIFATCYTWIPQWMLNTAVCLPCDQKLGFVSCVDVGIINPLDAITFWGYQIFGPAFCDLMIAITSAFSFIPGINDKTITTCNQLRSATGTQNLRQVLCGAMSLGTLAWVFAILYAIGVFIITVGLAILNVIHAIILLVPYLWIFNLINGAENPEGIFVVDGEEKPEDNTVRLKMVKKQEDLGGYMEGTIRKWLMPTVHIKTE